MALAVVFAVVGIGLPLIGIGVFHATDLLLATAPWSETEPTGFTPHLPYAGDTVDAILPQLQEFRNRLWHGDFGSWEGYVSGGSPLGAVPSLALLSPLTLPYLLLPTWYAPALVKLLEIAVCVAGTTLWLRRLGLSRPAGILAGTVFASSGFMVVWTNWPQTRVAAFVPALFWAVERLVQRRRPSDVALIAAVLALLLLGGFPAVTGLALYAAAPYLLMRLLIEHRRRVARVVSTVALGLCGLVLGIGLIAAQLVPFVGQLATLTLSYRQQTPEDHLPVSSLVTALVPGAYGLGTAEDAYYGPSNPIEVFAYVGVAAALLAAIGLAARPGSGVPRGVRTYLGVGLAVVLPLGWVGGAPLALAQHLPIFSDNPVGRIRVLFCFFVAALAGFGFDAVARGVLTGRVSRWRRLASVGVSLVVVGGIVFVLARASRYAAGKQSLPEFDGAVRTAAWLGMLALLLVVIAAVPARGRFGAARRTVALAGLPVLVVVQALAFVLPFWPRIDRSEFYPRTAAHDFLAANLGHERYAAERTVLHPSTGAYYGLRTLTGHTFRAQTWADLLVEGKGSYQSPTYSLIPGADAPAAVRSPVLDRFAVKYFAFAPGALPIGDAATAGTPTGRLTLVDGASVEVTVPARALRGVGPMLATPTGRPPDPFARLDAQVLGPDGTVLTGSSRRLYGGAAPGPFLVALPGEDLGSAPGGTMRVRLTLHARGSTLPLATTPTGDPVLSQIRSRPDGLRLVFADDVVIYQRRTALPRIRWAAKAVTIAGDVPQLQALSAGVPADTVVLDPGQGPAAALPGGSPASIEVLEDSGDAIRARVDAPAPGYLVVADAIQDGWSVSVDGRPATLRSADHAMVAVEVPAGSHSVRLAYAPPGRLAGLGISLLSIAVLVGLVVVGRVRRRGGAAPAGPPVPSEEPIGREGPPPAAAASGASLDPGRAAPHGRSSVAPARLGSSRTSRRP